MTEFDSDHLTLLAEGRHGISPINMGEYALIKGAAVLARGDCGPAYELRGLYRLNETVLQHERDVRSKRTGLFLAAHHAASALRAAGWRAVPSAHGGSTSMSGIFVVLAPPLGVGA